MFNRFIEATTAAAKVLKEGTITSFKALTSLGRIGSSIGTGLFGAKKFVEYVLHKPSSNSSYSHPYALVTVVLNVSINLLTKIPAMLRRDKKSDDVVSDDVEEVQAEVHSCTKACSHPTLGTLVTLCFHGVNILNSIGVLLGSYYSGKVLCEFIATQSDNEYNDADWKYYTIRGVSLCFAISNLYSYTSYVVYSVNKNRDSFVTFLLGKNEQPLNKKLALQTAGIVTLNLLSSTAFFYLSTSHSLKSIEEDIYDFPLNHDKVKVEIPAWLIATISGVSCGAGFIAEGMTTVPSIYNNLYSLFHDSDDVKQIPAEKWEKIMRIVTYPIAGLDAINVGLHGFASIALTSKSMAGCDPYGWILPIAFVCTLSKVPSYGSFNNIDGIERLMIDIKEWTQDKGPISVEYAPINQDEPDSDEHTLTI